MKQEDRLDCWQDWRNLWVKEPTEETCIAFLHWLCRRIEQAGELQLTQEQCEGILKKADQDCADFSRSTEWHSQRIPNAAIIGPKALRTFIPQLMSDPDFLKEYYEQLGWEMEEDGTFEGDELEVGVLVNQSKRLEIHGL